MKKLIIASLVSIISFGTVFAVFALGPSQRLDFVNIGTLASESGHNLQGWGAIEPTISGGNWGAIATESSCGLTNPTDCDKLLRVVYAKDELDHPQIIGRMASVTLQPSRQGWGLVRGLKIRALDGVANDDFMVFVRDKKGRQVLVYTYIADPSTTEFWRVHSIDLGPRFWLTSRPLEVTIMATGDTWAQHSTYGQLAIDWIELTGLGISNSNHQNDGDDLED